MFHSSFTSLLRHRAAPTTTHRRSKFRKLLGERLKHRCVMTCDLDHDLADGEPHCFPLPTADVILATSTPPAPAPAPLADTFKLHSNPNALHTIYLDFNGHVATGTQWNAWRNIPTITTAAWDPSGDGAPANATEQAMIQGIWQRVAEDFAPFNVNVTTEDPGPDAFRKSGADDTRWGIRVVITPTDWSSSGAGGHAWIGSFNSTVDEGCYVYNPTEITVSAAASHEIGHSMYLSHDGQNTTTYYNGHGTGETSWGPIMGSGYYANVTTWDTGSYYASSNAGVAANYGHGADDFAVITGNNGFGYLADDHGDGMGDATMMTYGTSDANPNRHDVGTYGVIGLDNDQDFFRITVGTGTIELTIDSYYTRYYASNGDGTYDYGYSQTPVGSDTFKSQGSNLDVLARLYDITGNIVAVSNPTGLSAVFDNLYLQAGTYFVSVDGTGVGNWAANPPTGYGNVVSVGQYYIRGTVIKHDAPNTNPVANPDLVATKTNTAVSFSVMSNDADAEGDPISVTDVTAPANGTVTWTANGSMTYTPSANFVGLDTFTYTISDSRGGTAVGTVSVQMQATIGLAKSRFSAGENVAVTFSGGPGNSGDRIAIYANDQVPSGTQVPVAWYYTNGTQAPGGTLTAGTVTLDVGSGAWPLAPGGYFVTFLGDGGTTELAARASFRVNSAPVAVEDFATTNEETLVTIMLVANDTDPDGDTVTLLDATSPSHGTLVRNINGWVHYTPALNYFGPDSFTYLIRDPYGIMAVGTVNVIVLPINDAPTAVADFAATLEETPVSIAVLTNDSDVDGDLLTVTTKTNGAKGAVATNADGTIIYTPNMNAFGSDSFTYTISDGNGGTRIGVVSVSIAGTQDPPVANNDMVMAYENMPNVFFVTSNDTEPDGNPLSVTSWTVPSHGTVTILSNGRATYTPVANFIGPDSFEYTITDGFGHYSTATVTLNVLWVNDPPIAGTDSTTTLEDTHVTIDVLANDSDVDGGSLSVTSRTNGTKGTTTIVGGTTVQYTPTANANGTDTFTYTVSDGQGGSTVGTVVVTISPTNDAPSPGADSVATDEDVPVTFNVLSNDIDIDGDALTVSSWTNPANGTVTITAAGAATYTPDFEYIGSDSFSYTVVDPHGLSSTTTVSLNVRAVATLMLNKVSYLSGETIIAEFDDGPGLPSDWLGIYEIDSEPSGGSYLNRLYTNNSSTPGGSLTTGIVTFGPSSGSWPLSIGSYYVAFMTGGVTELTPRAYFVINAAPVAQDDSANTNEDTAVNINVLSNDSDPDSQSALSLVSVTTPAHGTVQIVNNTVRYTPAANFFGEDVFRYTIRDDYGAISSAEIKVTVEPVKDSPVAGADTATTLEDTPVMIAVLANDTDPDNDSLRLTNRTNGAKGTVAIVNDTQVRYTPNANASGSDHFTYTVDDGDGGFSIGTVTVTITPVNDLPVVKNDIAATMSNTPVTIAVLANDTDPDGDPLTVTARTNGSLGAVVINANSTLTYTPNANVSGTDTFTYTVSDGLGGSAVGTVTLTITPANSAPTARADSAATNEDTRVTFNVRTNDTDPDGDPLVVTNWTNPTNGTVTVTAAGLATYTPAANFFGTDSFTYTIADGYGHTATATVSLNVNSVNDRPIVVADFVTTDEDTPLQILALANDTDIDGGTLTIIGRTNGTRGTVVIVGGNRVTYTPNTNVNGSDSFTYTVNDGQGATTVGTVNVTITPVNDAPSAVNDAAATSGTTPVAIAVMANDTDVDANPLTPQFASSPSNGTALANANGTITYTANVGFAGTDSFTYRVTDGQATSGLATVTITVHGPTKFIVVDSGTDRTYRYQQNGIYSTSTATSSLNRGAVGMASSADGSKQWVLDSNRNVYVYDANGTLLGSWTASGLDTPKGISVHGSDLWIVDTGTDRVYLYANATTRLSGSQAAVRNFQLPTTNRSPEDLVTDGTTIWVLHSGSPDKVFAYRSSDGFALGNWTIDVANTNPVGITLDPTGVSQSLWIVDSSKDRVYEYASGRSLLSGTHLATSSFALNSGNTSPQGVAWIGAPAAIVASSAPTSMPVGNAKLKVDTLARREVNLSDDSKYSIEDDSKETQELLVLRSPEAESPVNTRARRKLNSGNIEWIRSVDAVFADAILDWEFNAAI